MDHTSTLTSGGALALTDWGVMRAHGDDAASFLQGQLTQDVQLQSAQQARLVGYCSPKGRLLAVMLAFKPQADELLLALPTELLAPTLKRLSMFVLRARCKLSAPAADDAAHGWQVWGLAGQAAHQWLGAHAPQQTWDASALPSSSASGRSAWVTRLPDDGQTPRWQLLWPSDAAAPQLPPLPAEAWQLLEVQSGMAWLRSATVEQLVPQMLNLELLGGVNFKKGCYPGQEVVARSQYRGTLKRRTQRLALPPGVQAQVGQELFHSDDPEQPAGMVVATAPGQILAELKLAALASGQVHLAEASGPVLTLLTLPYEFVDVT
ncbi:YgfZ/GcvT domain-containing protein [Roseateles sp. BYS180W]|uniref:YgfZ/GcvT domain-containing protein n=1 Tax=Roseateles rivi TaxID=3299028 RepID=A0ABW7FXR8_9BURK